jgi:hypothetical protein
MILQNVPNNLLNTIPFNKWDFAFKTNYSIVTTSRAKEFFYKFFVVKKSLFLRLVGLKNEYSLEHLERGLAK